MTNTRITDPELLENRYPVRLECFALRHGSGGDGRFRGGDGLIREIRFLEPASLSVLSQHRVEAPFGACGGDPGARGRQQVLRADGSREPLQGIDSAEMNAGDRIRVETPGEEDGVSAERQRIGIDLGGTKIEGIVLDADGAVCERVRRATPQGYQATLVAIADVVRELESGGANLPVGVGTPGAVSPATGWMKNANSTCLIDRPLREDLERVLERRVRLANDANCFALSEAVDGAAMGHRVVFGGILGTGVGGGIIVDGRPLSGVNAIAGEWGHNPLPNPGDDERPGPACYCGRRGCIESWLSGPAMSADHERHGGPAWTARQIAASPDAAAAATLERYAHRLARSLSGVINVLDPDCVVLGGGLSRIDSLYQRVPELWGTWIFSDRVDTRLVPPLHGDAGGARGAAWLWPVEERR